MLDLKILEYRSIDSLIISKLLLNYNIVFLVDSYSNKVVDILLNSYSKVDRWNTEGLEIKKRETNTQHILEMLYITTLYFKKYPELSIILNIEEIITKIAIHDLGEIGTGDLSLSEQKILSKEELEKNNKKEYKYALKIINNLKKENISQNKINHLKKYYIEYENNKNNSTKLNDYFVKFIDMFQALIHSTQHINNFQEIEPDSSNNTFQKLKEYNIVFEKEGFNLLENFNTIIDKDFVTTEDIKKCLIKK